MSLTFTLLLAVQILSSLAIIMLVLLQQGKGADMGSAFGSGSAGSLFGATGAANFLSRATKWAAVVFFVTTVGLAYVANRGLTGQDTGIMQNFTQEKAPAAPSGSAVPVVSGSAAPAGPGVASVPAPASGASSVPSVPAAPGVVPAAGVPAVPPSAPPSVPANK